MRVGLDLGLIMRRIRAGAILNRTPPLGFLAYLAHVAFTPFADQMPAFVDPHSLPLDLLAADPAAVLLLQFLQKNVPQLLEREFVFAARAVDRRRLLLHPFKVGWRVLQSPESRFDVLFLSGVELVNAYRLDVLGSNPLRSTLVLAEQLAPLGNLHEPIELLELLHLLNFFFEFLLFFQLLLPLLRLLDLTRILGDFLLLLDEVLYDAGTAEHVPLVACSGLDEPVVADAAHFEGFDGVLPHPTALAAVGRFQLLPLHVGEHRGGSVVF